MASDNRRPEMFARDRPPTTWNHVPRPGESRVGDRFEYPESEETMKYGQVVEDAPSRPRRKKGSQDLRSQAAEGIPQNVVKTILKKLVGLDRNSKKDSHPLGGFVWVDIGRASSSNAQRAHETAEGSPLDDSYTVDVYDESTHLLSMEMDRGTLRVTNGLPASVEEEQRIKLLEQLMALPERSENAPQLIERESREVRNSHPYQNQQPPRCQQSQKASGRDRPRERKMAVWELNKPLPPLPPEAYEFQNPRAGEHQEDSNSSGREDIPSPLRIGRPISPMPARCTVSPSRLNIRQMHSALSMSPPEPTVKDREHGVFNHKRNIPNSLTPHNPHFGKQRAGAQSEQPVRQE